YSYYEYYRNQGSYAMYTLNQHPENDYDIDIAIVFRKDDLPTSPLEARKRIADAFVKAGGNFSKAPEARNNAVTVWYAEGYHIDFAIYRKYEDVYGNTVIEHAGPEWMSRDPMEITVWFNQAVRDKSPSKTLGATVGKNQMRRVVQLLKAFTKSRTSWSLPGGLIISSLVDECYRSDFHRDDVSLYNTMVAIRNRLLISTQVANPANSQQMLTNKTKYQKQVERLRDRLSFVISKLDGLFSSDCTEQEAMKAWNWVFRHSFWSEESLVDNIQEQKAQLLPFGKLKISARLAMTKGGRFSQHYPSGSRFLPKNLWLHFSVAKTSVKPPYETHWIVQNYGDEAEEEDDLTHKRITPSTWEHTAYKGSHDMICELRRTNVVLARAVHVVKIKR
ncbi:MAG: hypothetical protein GY928_07295, partial [Colwellia sp.]|nr:hypothetical protein [Colwellia sp.]